MATRLWVINPGEQNTDVIEGVGAATSAKAINLTVDFGSIVNDQGTTRAPTQAEVINALDDIRDHIMRQNSWPPA